MVKLRCGHTNMYHYFGRALHSDTGFLFRHWKEHHNPIVVLRNPLDRVMSAAAYCELIKDEEQNLIIFGTHSLPYMHNMIGFDFRIIDFYDLEQYIPREKMQSYRSNSRVGDATIEDVYVANEFYSFQMLQTELDIYNEFMVTKDRVSVEEWKKLTNTQRDNHVHSM